MEQISATYLSSLLLYTLVQYFITKLVPSTAVSHDMVLELIVLEEAFHYFQHQFKKHYTNNEIPQKHEFIGCDRSQSDVNVDVLIGWI